MIQEPSAQDTTLLATPFWRRKKLLLGIVLFASVAGGGGTLLSAWSKSAESVSMARLRIAQVGRGTLVRDAAVNGRLVAAVSPTLYASAQATVHFRVKAGDTVKQGDIVAELDSPELGNAEKREQAIYEQLEAEVARQHILARKQKLLAQRDADAAEIDRVSAERTYQRIEAAGYAGVIAKIDFLKAQDALKSAEIRAKHAQLATQLENDDVDVVLKTKLSQLQQQRLIRDNAKRKVEELKLRAPVNGLVGTLAVGDRTAVAANTALMTLVDLSQLEVELEIPESYVADLGLGMNVEVSINGNKAMGTLSALSPEVVKNQVLARVRFTGTAPTGLRQSQRVSARLLIEEKPHVLLLQRGSFIENQGARNAWVLENGYAKRVPIRIGATSVTEVEIASGLKEGDKVVISGTDLFGNASTVQINP